MNNLSNQEMVTLYLTTSFLYLLKGKSFNCKALFVTNCCPRLCPHCFLKQKAAYVSTSCLSKSVQVFSREKVTNRQTYVRIYVLIYQSINNFKWFLFFKNTYSKKFLKSISSFNLLYNRVVRPVRAQRRLKMVPQTPAINNMIISF